MTRPAVTLITIAVETAKLDRYRRSIEQDGFVWSDNETEFAIAADMHMDRYIKMDRYIRPSDSSEERAA